MRCNNCGNDIAGGVNFCPVCGATLKSSEKGKLSLIVALAGSVVSFLALFLPFLKISVFYSESQSLSLMNGNLRTDGLILSAILVGGVLLVLTGKNSKGIRNFVVGGIVCFIALVDLFNNKGRLSAGALITVSAGIGFYLVMLGGITIIVSGVLRNKNM